MLIDTLGITDPVDAVCPVNWLNLLNKGKEFWGYTPNGWHGGSRLPNLAQHTRPETYGTLVNEPGWTPTPYGMGLLFSGTVKYVNGSVTVTGPPITWMAAVRPASLANYRGIVGRPGANAQAMLLSGGGGNPLAYIWDSAIGEYNWASGLTLTVGAWHVVAVSLTATAATGFVWTDGGGIATATVANSHTTRAVTDYQIGAERNGSGGSHWLGEITGACIFSRAITAGEFGLHVGQFRRGHPDTLRRVRPRSFGISEDEGPEPDLNDHKLLTLLGVG